MAHKNYGLKVIFYGFDGMFTICFYFHPQSIRVQRNLFYILFLFSFLHPWRIDQLLWSILLLVLNINWINLFANFAAFALVGHTIVLNLFSKDNCGNEGIMDPNFSKKLFLSFENRGHLTQKMELVIHWAWGVGGLPGTQNYNINMFFCVLG